MIPYAQGIFGLYLDNEFDFRKDKMISWSQYSKYTKCPKSWELRYVRKKRFPSDSIHTIYGTAMHEVIQTFLYYCYHKTVKQANNLDLNKMLMDTLKSEYKKAYEKHKIHFSSPEQLSEYYCYGVEILNHIKKKRTGYFSTRNCQLIGIEIPIISNPDKNRDNVKLMQYLDLVFYDKRYKEYLIVDIKTSTKGWNKWKRKDFLAKNQLVCYKKYFCEEFNIDPKKVEIMYFIMRNKIDTDSMYPIPRISEFKPSSGKITMSRVEKSLLEFIDDCFDKNGNYKDKNYPAMTGRNQFNCTFCEYKDKHDLCPPENRITE